MIVAVLGLRHLSPNPLGAPNWAQVRDAFGPARAKDNVFVLTAPDPTLSVLSRAVGNLGILAWVIGTMWVLELLDQVVFGTRRTWRVFGPVMSINGGRF